MPDQKVSQMSPVTSWDDSELVEVVQGGANKSATRYQFRDILFYTDQATFPISGDAKILYVDKAVNKIYRWTGSAYVEVSAGGSGPANTDALTEGTTNLYFTNSRADARIAAQKGAASGIPALNASGHLAGGTASTPDNRLRQRTDTAANWTSSNPTLLNGEFGFETDSARFKVGDGSTAWNSLKYFKPMSSYDVEYWMVGGGGGSGGARKDSAAPGGAGAGGVLSGTLTVQAGTSYPITIGSGGTGNTGDVAGTVGGNTTFNGLTALGGGASDGYAGAVATRNGGSGAGANHNSSSNGTGTAGQGNAGGVGSATYPNCGAGGGGAGAAGAAPVSAAIGGQGGVGVQSSISGSATYYAGGGSGGSYNGSGTIAGGNGGGGAGSNTSGNGGDGTANTGGGGGAPGGAGTGTTTFYKGGNGGSGIFILRYPGPQLGTGGSASTAGGYTMHVFTTLGNFIA